MLSMMPISAGQLLATLTVTNAPATFNNYIFRVIVSGTCGVPVYSNFAVLRVNISADGGTEPG